MRLLLIGIAAIAALVAANEAITFTPENHGNYYEDLPEEQESLPRRIKRSVFASIGFTSQCEPGWTGQFCENPVCSGEKANPIPPNYPNRHIDQLYLPSGCTGKYYVPVDSLSFGLTVIVSASSGSPWVNLTDTNGNVMQAQQSPPQGGTTAALYPITLPPGGYQLTIDNGGVPTVDCIVTIEAFSQLVVNQGFTFSPHSDETPMDESAYDGVGMYLVAHATNVTTPGQVKAVTIRSDKSMHPSYRSTLTQRYSCGFEFYAGTFVCNKNNRYIYHVDGIDQNGYPFRRGGNFACLEMMTTPAPTPQPINVCYNGGTILRAGTANASCFCPELFTGNQCQYPNCMNNGHLAPNGLECICRDGQWGTNCEHTTCDPNFGQFLVDFKTLVVVVRNTVSMNQYGPIISKTIMDGLEGNSDMGLDVYDGYVLVRFGGDSYLPKYYPSSLLATFLHDLSTLNSSQIDAGCTDDNIFNSIYSVFIEPVYEKSPIFVFTDAVPSDPQDFTMVTESNSRRKLPIFTFFLNQTSCNIDPIGFPYRSLQDASFFSGGLVFKPKDGNALGKILQSALRDTAYKMNLVMADDMLRCQPMSPRAFMVDSSAVDVVILAVGNTLLTSLTDPDLGTSSLQTIWNDGYNYVFEVIGVQPGNYLFDIQSASGQDPCSYRIMARSDYDLYFATSEAEWLDAIDSEPVVGTPVHLVAQLNGLVGAIADPFRLFSELTITTNINQANQMAKPMYYSSGTYRDGCGYHLYFGVANFCETPNQPFYATVFADDNLGFTIQRTSIGYCSQSITTVAPPGSCQNGGVFDPTNNNTCICVVGYYGDFCEKIACQNGGTPLGSYCVCAPGTAGTFCEQYTCPAVNIGEKFSFEGQSMTFVISAKPSMQDAINQLATGIADFVRDVQDQSSTWINRWVLVVVNQDDSDIVVNSNVPQDFVNGVRMVAANLTNFISPTNQNCSVDILGAMLTAAYYSEPRSQIYTFVDSDGPETSFLQLFSIVTDYQITLNMILATNNICLQYSTNGELPDYIQEIVYWTSGFIYVTPNTGKMLPLITSTYKSGTTGQAGGDDCTNGITAYIPVDSWTKSFTIATTGGNVTSVKVTLPDGSPGLNDNAEIQLINDPYLNLIQFITPCPDGWQVSKQQYCYTFTHKPQLSWRDAAGYCHQLGGSLADIFTEQTQADVFFQAQGAYLWIGLIRHNDGWVWDVPGNNHYQMLSGYTNWCDNYPTTAGDCVAMSPNGCWQNMDCNTETVFSCQKHKYTMTPAPGESNSNTLMPGRWRVDIQTSTGGCYAQVRSQSDIQVFYGFVNDPHLDYPASQINEASKSNYLIANPVNLAPWMPDVDPSMEGRLNYAFLEYNKMQNFVPLSLNNRPFCAYPMISATPFTCSTDNENYYIKFSGIDQFGYPFERYSDTVCMNLTPTCFNGGFMNDGQCVCQPGYTGSRCQTPLCQNNGVEQDGKCVCEPMFMGLLCEEPICEPPYPTSFADKGRTLAILLETSYNMGSTIFQMKKNLQTALDDINQDPSTAGWFNEYILYPFDSTTNRADWYPITVTNSVGGLIAAVKAIPTMTCPGTGTCSPVCQRPLMTVLNDTLYMDALAKPNSVIMVVSRSSPEDYEMVNAMTQKLQETKAQINFVLPAIDSPCSEGWETAADFSLYRTVGFSDGSIFVMSAVDFSGNFMQQYLPTIFKSAGLEMQSPQNCSYNELLFAVDHSMFEFTIDLYTPVTNPPMKAVLTDPAGDVVPLPPNLLTSDTNYLGILQVNDSGIIRAGTYRLAISAGGGNRCYYNVRGRSGVELFVGYVDSSKDAFNGATNDAAHYAPSQMNNNTIVVHAAGLDGGILTYAQVVDPVFGLIHTTTMAKRYEGCSYEWYATKDFFCYVESVLVVIYGRDAQGAIVRRNFMASCVATTPLPPPPPAFCDLSLVQQDTLFMIDSSIKQDNMIFKELSNFASTTMMSYKLSPNYTQVAAMTVSDKAYGGFSFLANQNNTWSNLNSLLMNLQYTGQPGQNTSSGFEMAANKFDTAAQGYRQGVKHTIVYLTNTNPTDADPDQWPYTLRRSGLYGIVVVAYNMTPSAGMRSMVSDQCLYVSPNADDLYRNALNFVQLMSCYRFPICGI